MGKALYRKYRSKSLGEIVGQEHITTTLEKALKSGRISHAYLFSGPRGVGKTSIARILAHEINGLPYTDDSAHLDIIEIDAASNRRIDEIRDLRDKVYIAPTSGKYKVYIIDEVHMLTREAFNALLKTLEEPPAHVVFILATTESHKLPDTIISRTQHYTFKPVEKQKVIDHLAYIAKKEKIAITPEALAILADHGEGSFRDSISLLDQAAGLDTKVDATEVRRLLGIAPQEAIDRLIALLASQSSAADVLSQLSVLYDQGLQAASIASQLAASLRNGLIQRTQPLATTTALGLMRELVEVSASHNPERLLEIILLAHVDSAHEPVAAVAISAAEPAPVRPSVKTDLPSAAKTPKKPAAVEAVQPIASPQKQTEAPNQEHPATAEISEPAPGADRLLNDTAWPEVLDGIKKQYNTLYGVLRMAKPVFSDDAVELQFKFAFHQKRLNEVKNRKIISDFIRQVTGKNIAVRCTINKDAVPATVAITAAATSVIAAPAMPDSISDIFGGGEVIG